MPPTNPLFVINPFGMLYRTLNPIVDKKENKNCFMISNILFYPPKYIFKTIPTPKAMDKAEKIASMALDKPETKSPDMVSLIAFVMATPGTKGIIDEIITTFIFSAIPIVVNNMDKIVAIIELIKLFMKKVNLYLFILFTVRTTKKPINILDIKSSTLPPNKMDKNPQDNPPNKLLKSSE